jgi:diguanylate cyclase (GGDEF)-like protein
MDVFLRIDINIIAFIVLSIIVLIASKRLDKQETMNRAFFRVSNIVLLLLAFETGTCIINRLEGRWLIELSNFLHMCLFTSGAILSYEGYLLIYQFVHLNKIVGKKSKILLGLPILVNTFFVLLSPIFGFVFSIDGTNTYHRGNLFYISFVIIYGYMFFMNLLIIKNRNKLGKTEFVLLLIFSSFPLIGGIIQALFYGVLLMWSSTAFALILMYSYLQQRMVQLDHLTGVWNRASFDFYIKNRMMQKCDTKLGIIYCDIDSLKQINDEYGHIEGDYAIKMTTQLFRESIRKTDIVVRMGGDEFIIVLECDIKNILDTTIERIEKKFYIYNDKSMKPYELSCSFGADELNQDYNSIEQFLHHVDCLMYENKKRKKDIATKK